MVGGPGVVPNGTTGGSGQGRGQTRVRGMDTSQFGGSEPPDLYSDSVRVGSTPYSFIFHFGLLTESPGEQKHVVTIRMSPQHAWVLSRILQRHLEDYEQNVAPIQLPEALLKDLGLDED